MPTHSPKLPSIWNGGQASNRLGYSPPSFHGARRPQQVPQDQGGVVAVAEPRPEIHLPAHAPTRGRVPAVEERLPRRVKDLLVPAT